MLGDSAPRTSASGAEEGGVHPTGGATSVAPPGRSATPAERNSQKTILVLASAEPAPDLLGELGRRRLETGAQVLVVVPLQASGLGLWTNDDRWRIRAEGILERTAGLLAAAGIACSGRIGDADARQALDDALRAEDVAEIMVVDPGSASLSRLEQELALRTTAGHERPSVTVVPAAPAAPPPRRGWSRRTRRIAAAALAAVALAFVLGTVASGGLGVLAGIGFVLGVIALNVGPKIAVLAALWVALRHWSLGPPPR